MQARRGRSTADGAVFCAALFCTAAACRPPAPPAARDAGHLDARASRDVSARDVHDAAVAAPIFAPHWACRISGLGHVGHAPQVSVPSPPPHADARAIWESLTLADHGTLRRAPAARDGGLDFSHATLVRLDPAGAVLQTRTYATRTSSLEMLFTDGASAGVAFWDGARVTGTALGETNERDLVPAAHALDHPCAAPPVDTLRLVPLSVRPLPFPPIAGMPPSAANARYVLAREGEGACVARLEGEGPWGRVLVEASTQGLRGELSLGEGIYPVECAPAEH